MTRIVVRLTAMLPKAAVVFAHGVQTGSRRCEARDAQHAPVAPPDNTAANLNANNIGADPLTVPAALAGGRRFAVAPGGRV